MRPASINNEHDYITLSSDPVEPVAPRRGIALTFLFAVTLLVSASLLFCVQPMIAKMILPFLGGSPSVWNTCMVFFQAMLLAGYAYAHGTTVLLGVRRQALVHLALLAVPLLVLPFVISEADVRSLAPDANPTPWLLGLLFTSVGLPFFVVATTAPLLQMWFNETGHRSGKDPYFLYGASNFGSMLALLGYPILMEPNLRLARQSVVWAVGYGALATLTLACGVVVLRSPQGLTPAVNSSTIEEVVSRSPRFSQRLSWVGLAFVPSSLLLGVTTYLSTDVASIPLLWVIPLALYLLTFVLAFAKRGNAPQVWMGRGMRMVTIVLAVVICLQVVQVIYIPLHLLMFFLAAMVCHRELARRRPGMSHLTEFYLAISVGGVLGGVFNALVAPVVFDRVVEYPLAIAMACLALPSVASGSGSRGPKARILDFAFPLALGFIVFEARRRLGDQPAPAWSSGDIKIKVLYGLAGVACFMFADRPLRFALGIASLLTAGMLTNQGQVLLRERSFFGTIRVVRVEPGPYHQLIHGNTLHGQQSLEPRRGQEPLTYYHRTGPIGQVFDFLGNHVDRSNVAIVGLGTGSLAAYARPGERWTFYEIDPSIVRIANNPVYFTYLRDCHASAWEVLLGDARLRLHTAPGHEYELIVLDAFSSDAVPVHLLTREAINLYRSKLAPHGIIAFNISNRYLDLTAVVRVLARAEGLVCRVRQDPALSPLDQRMGKTTSIWAIMAGDEDDLGPLAQDPAWVVPTVHRHEAAWTDDFSSILEHIVIH
jgi:hypothetical protein